MYGDQSGEFVGGYRKKGNFKADLDCMIFFRDNVKNSQIRKMPMLPFVGDALYDEMESSTLDMPDKKKYKRPPSGVRQTRRSASAEMIDRDEDEGMADNENMSPARRRPRRKRNQGKY